MAPRRVLPLVGALLLVLAARGEADAPRLRGSVACHDCAAGHDLSGVVVAVRCAGGGAGILRAAQTDARSAFDVAMPAAAVPTSSSSATPCAARVLGATEQLCAPRGLAVARVVPARAASPSPFYTLGYPLAFFTARCRPASGDSAVATNTDDDASDQKRQRAAPRVPPPARPAPPDPEMQAPGRAPPRAGGNTSRRGRRAASHLLLPVHPHHRHP